MICFHFTIFVVLGTTKQYLIRSKTSCDLLSFYYLCRTRNNPYAIHSATASVVICFHFTIFVVLGTTHVAILLTLFSCDLLSFYYLCRTRNNVKSYDNPQDLVVICFHFTIFVVLGTTLRFPPYHPAGCDLLSFYYLCRTRNNLRFSSNFRC